MQDLFGCKSNETFFVELVTKYGIREAFTCKENSDKFQRYCLPKSLQNCVIDVFYNTSFSKSSSPNYDYSSPYIRELEQMEDVHIVIEREF